MNRQKPAEASIPVKKRNFKQSLTITEFAFFGGGETAVSIVNGDRLGNRTAVTETIRQPGSLAGVTAFLEENGQLVLEAESGTTTAGTTHSWNSQTTQNDYAGTAYLRALPDIGQQYDANASTDSPGLNFTVQIDNPGSYTVWARGMAADAASDSLHVGVDNGTPTTAASLTGFVPNEW
ncbi:MAG: hypothetical protein GY803_12250, partial [Chloroflexi bacterium]|nr:hypothetical protein [Chloroflexota bacterium]